MIRILHYIGSLESGGSQAMIMNIYRNIDRNKIQFDFVIHDRKNKFYKSEIEKLGGKIFICPNYTGKNHFSYVRWWNEFFSNHSKYHIFHCHVRSCSSFCLKIAKNNGLYTIAHSHNTSNGKGISGLVKDIIQYPTRFIADYFFACSKEAGEWMFGKHITSSSRFKILKNAIDTKKYIYNPKKQSDFRKKLGINGKFVVGTIGRLTIQKNPFFIIDIIKEINKIIDDFVFIWIGTGELENEVKAKLKSEGLLEKVIMTGAISNVQDYLQVMDVFVFPSLWEGLGIVAVEAQAAGLKTICSDRIPQEANVTKLYEKISLEKSSDIWARSIVKYKDGYDRINTFVDIKEAGYDIKNNADFIQKFYYMKCR